MKKHMGIKTNKATRQNGNRKIVGAIKKHLRGSVTLDGDWTLRVDDWGVPVDDHESHGR